MSEFKPKRLTPEESANAWAEGERRSNELRQQTAKMRLPPVGAESEIAQLRQRLEAAEAEVAAWRRAVRWRKANRWELRLWTKTGPIELGTVRDGMPSIGEPDGWVAEADDLVPVTGFPDRNAACAKVCELLGIPVVLP